MGFYHLIWHQVSSPRRPFPTQRTTHSLLNKCLYRDLLHHRPRPGLYKRPNHNTPRIHQSRTYLSLRQIRLPRHPPSVLHQVKPSKCQPLIPRHLRPMCSQTQTRLCSLLSMQPMGQVFRRAFLKHPSKHHHRRISLRRPCQHSMACRQKSMRLLKPLRSIYAGRFCVIYSLF